MPEQSLIEAAREWLEANTPMRWTTEPGEGEEGISLEELNRRPQMWAERLAAFAAEAVRAERERIAGEIRGHHIVMTGEALEREMRLLADRLDAYQGVL